MATLTILLKSAYYALSMEALFCKAFSGNQIIIFSFYLVLLNTCMNLQDIRNKTGYDPSAAPTQKAAARAWLHSLCADYPVALTLTLKQTVDIVNIRGSHKLNIKRDDCERIAKRFIQKLNRQAFGHSAERHGKGLKYLVVVEGERSSKNLHLHLAIGAMPKHVKFNQIAKLVEQAKAQVAEIDEQYKVDITDSGWMEYISKELGAKDTDNVLWQLA